MTTYLDKTCDNCRHSLRVRLAYVGKRVMCNRCHHKFLVTADPASYSSDAEKPEPGMTVASGDTVIASPQSGGFETENRILQQRAHQLETRLNEANLHAGKLAIRLDELGRLLESTRQTAAETQALYQSETTAGEQLRQRLEQLEQSLGSSSQEQQQLRKALDEAGQRYDTDKSLLHAEWTAEQSRLLIQRQEQESLLLQREEQIRSLHAEVENLHHEVASRTAERDRALEHATTIEQLTAEETRLLHERIESLERQYKQTHEETGKSLTAVRGEADAAVAALREAEARLAELQRRQAEQGQQLAERSARLEALQSELASDRHRAEQLVRDGQRESLELRQHLTHAQSRINELEQARLGEAAHWQQLHEQGSSLAGDLATENETLRSTLRSTMIEVNKREQLLSQEIDALRLDLKLQGEGHAEEMGRTSTEIRSLRLQLEELNKERWNALTEVEKLTHQRQEDSMRFQQERNNHEMTRRTLAETERRLKELESARSTDAFSYQREQAEIYHHADELFAQVAVLEGEHQRAAKEEIALRSRLIAAESEVQRLHATLAKTQADLAEAKSRAEKVSTYDRSSYEQILAVAQLESQREKQVLEKELHMTRDLLRSFGIVV